MRNPAWDAAVLDAKCLVARAQKCDAYQFADGFDNYNSAAQMYDQVVGSIVYSSAFARFAPPPGLPGQGVRIASGASYVLKNLISNQATLIIRLAVNFASLGSGLAPFLGAADAGAWQWTLNVTAAGALAIVRGNSGATQVITGPGAVSTGRWYGIELQVTIAGSASTANVWVNGVSVIVATGINCQNTSNAFASRVGFGDPNLAGLVGMLADDFRVWDNTGATQNAALGTDSRMISKMASGAGAVTQFTPNGAAANWQCTDEVPPDDDTTYVSNSTAGNADAYAMPVAGFTVAPAMVVARSRARKDDGAARALEIGVDSSGSIAVGSPVTMGSSYAWIDACIALDPHTSGAWTAAGADAAQHYKIEST